ncbi:MAG: hypothetical protein JWM53_3411, partial [bacterium]|nr:hypothetical protein [bacterium]
MKPSRPPRGLSDTQLAALVESLPEGMGLYDEAAAPLWMNRQARRLLSLRSTLNPEDTEGTSLARLLPRLIETVPTWRFEQHARWAVAGGGVVRVVLRRIWGSQLAAWLHGPAPAEQDASNDAYGAPKSLSPAQLIVAERLLDEAVVGLAVTSSAGRICWMNQQAERLLCCGQQLGHGAQRRLARAARHVARRSLVAPVRTRLH